MRDTIQKYWFEVFEEDMEVYRINKEMFMDSDLYRSKKEQLTLLV